MKKILFFAALFTLIRCENDVYKNPECLTLELPELSYSVHVYPIINKTCAIPECHTTGFEYGDFNRFEVLKDKAISGKLRFMIEAGQMPHGFTDGPEYLTKCEIETIKKWIDEGANNN